jgi:sigma-B regulation protein RsbU (phosphoserine phosphatase)
VQGLHRLEKLRHELRTYLNHIIGYAEILKTDALEYGRGSYLGGLESISSKADKIRRLISFFLDAESDYLDMATSEDVKKAFFVPLMQIITDTRQLIVKFKREDPAFVNDGEQILNVANQMLQLVEEEIIDIQLEELYESRERPSPSLPTVTSTRERDDEDIPDFKEFDVEEDFQGEKARNPGEILLVDDSAASRILIGRHLAALGHRIREAESGELGLEMLRDFRPDLIILDVLMPDMTGYQVLRELKRDERTREIPVIMLSAVQNSESIAQCIKMGAEDYLPKDYEPSILKARIDASIEKTRLQQERERYTEALIESQSALAAELREAANYITAQLPNPLEGDIRSRLFFKPSAQLGGDFFNHFWLDAENLCMFLLDASGHGIRSALLAISISHLLGTRSLPGTSFTNPASVLKNLNRNFQIEDESSTFFTIWYGVYNRRERVLRYSSAGAAPAVFIKANSDRVHLLGSEDIIIGALEDSEYAQYEQSVGDGDRLFLFSDGIFEIIRSTGKMLGLEEFVELLALTPGNIDEDIPQIMTQIEALSADENFEDDVSLLEISF